MLGVTYIDETNWIYENSGTANLLSVSGTTLTVDSSKSKTGTAFYQTQRVKCFDIPATKEFWIQCNIYHTGSNSSRFRFYDEGNSGANGICLQTDGDIEIFCNGNQTAEQYSEIKKDDTLQTYHLHMISDSVNGLIEFWVDGIKYGRYLGNVNGGADFQNFYLQSDDENNLFSSVIISNFENAVTTSTSQNIKSEIYISWIPRGDINFKPLIFASIIPAEKVFTKNKVDTNRRVSKSEIFSADTIRKIGEKNFVQNDSARIVKKFESTQADLLRQLTFSEKIFSDTFRKIFLKKNYSDLFRRVKKFEKNISDTSRKLNIATVKFDTCVIIKSTAEIKSDTNRRIGFLEKNSVDTYRKIFEKNFITADTCRKIKFSAKIYSDTLRRLVEKNFFDTLIKNGISEKKLSDTSRILGSYEIIKSDTVRKFFEKNFCDTSRKVVTALKIKSDTIIRTPHILKYTVNSPLVSTFKDYGVTLFSVTLAETTLSDTFQIELAYPFEINDLIQGQFLDYPFKFLVEETSQQDLMQSIKGMYDQDELLYTKFVAATYTIKKRQEKNSTGYTTTIKTREYYSAGAIFDTLAHVFGKVGYARFSDFVPYNIEPDVNTTYKSYISALFGWTSRLPHRQINVFIRGETLYCIQRGMEEKTFDISNISHSRPIINKKLLRTMWNRGNYEGTVDDYETEIREEWGETSETKPFSGTISFADDGCSTTLTYTDGLLTLEENKVTQTRKVGNQSSNNRTTYSYKRIVPEGYQYFIDTMLDDKTVGDYYIESKSTKSYSEIYGEPETLTEGEDSQTIYKDKSVKTYSNVGYKYQETQAGDIYLLEERDNVEQYTYEQKQSKNTNSKDEFIGFTANWELTDSETHTRQTFHVPLGNGWYGQSVYVDGVAQGSNVSQGTPGNKISLYTIEQVRQTFTRAVIKPTNNDGGSSDDSSDPDDEYKKARAKLAPTADISFPVREFNQLRELTNELIRLNRKIQEEISVDLYVKIIAGVPEILHIIDFTERIILDGNEYYLVSNNFIFTPRKLVQKLKLIRWY